MLISIPFVSARAARPAQEKTGRAPRCTGFRRATSGAELYRKTNQMTANHHATVARAALIAQIKPFADFTRTCSRDSRRRARAGAPDTSSAVFDRFSPLRARFACFVSAPRPRSIQKNASYHRHRESGTLTPSFHPPRCTASRAASSTPRRSTGGERGRATKVHV